MTIHVYGAVITANGTAANNRGENSGNVATLQKLVWNGKVHTTVSAESIRFALRRRLAETEPCNRTYNDETRKNDWEDHEFKRWADDAKENVFIDDDLLGFMAAEAAKEDASDVPAEPPADGKKAKTAKKKGTITVRRAVLEVTRSVSLTPWSGDSAFNVASPAATASAAKKGRDNPVPYGVEMHATRYQYGFALTPTRLQINAGLKPGSKELVAAQATRTSIALQGLCALGEVAGNHGRFLFDFSPESIVFRITHDPAPRILYAFEAAKDGVPQLGELLEKVKAGDIKATELVIGGLVARGLNDKDKETLKGASIHSGVMAACAELCKRLENAS